MCFTLLKCINSMRTICTKSVVQTARYTKVVSTTKTPLFAQTFYIDNSGVFTNFRMFSSTPVFRADGEMIDVTFVTSDGTKIQSKGKIGDNLLDVVVNNDLDLDGYGACEGTLACSTCHLVFEQSDFDKIKDKVTDEELDMLDLAYGLCDTSRLGCQVTLTKELNGVVVKVPAGVNDARS